MRLSASGAAGLLSSSSEIAQSQRREESLLMRSQVKMKVDENVRCIESRTLRPTG